MLAKQDFTHLATQPELEANFVHTTFGLPLKENDPCNQKSGRKYMLFLTQLYEQTAEFIPDGLNSNKRPRRGTSKFDRPDLNRDSIKHLPYGTINDYFKQCVAAHPGLGIGRKLFCSDACLGLADILKFKVCVCNTNQNIWQVSIVFVLFLYHFSLKLDLFRVPCNSTNPRFGKRTLRGNYAYGFSPTTPNAASVFVID